MFTLAPTEIAASMSYLLTGGPADDTLATNASAGMLATSDGREQEARRLIATAAGRARLVRVVREWLGIDDVAHREKAASVYPGFAGVSAAMEAESTSFINEVVTSSTGTIGELLGADWTIVDAALASVYGVTSAGAGKRTSLAGAGRRGILNQAAFLSVFATNNGSHPVFRGVALMRRVACLTVPDPGALGIVVSFPATDATKTTRDRFVQHARDTSCANCHASIDAFGFAFEGYDGMGQARTTENGMPIDSRVTVAVGSDFDGTYADSNALATALAASPSVRTCLARQLFRSSAGRSDSYDRRQRERVRRAVEAASGRPAGEARRRPGRVRAQPPVRRSGGRHDARGNAAGRAVRSCAPWAWARRRCPSIACSRTRSRTRPASRCRSS